MNLDISTIKVLARVKVTMVKPQWSMLVDEKTNMKWSEFYKHKNDFVEPLCTKMHRWKEAGIPVQIWRCDNTGENTLLEKRSDSANWKLNFKFKYTVCEMPQQNSLVEVSFATIGNRGRTMMIQANVP
eukprot:14432751-Ditylum_brightwellii.AAC.1